jgi:transcriptional regulator with XRE-family HTH domain
MALLEVEMDGTKFWANVKSRMGYMRNADLSRVTGIKANSIRMFKHRGTIPSVDQCYKIAKALGCTVDELVSEAVKA